MTGQTYGDKVVSQEGNSPKQKNKVPKLLFSVIKNLMELKQYTVSLHLILINF